MTNSPFLELHLEGSPVVTQIEVTCPPTRMSELRVAQHNECLLNIVNKFLEILRRRENVQSDRPTVSNLPQEPNFTGVNVTKPIETNEYSTLRELLNKPAKSMQMTQVSTSNQRTIASPNLNKQVAQVSMAPDSPKMGEWHSYNKHFDDKRRNNELMTLNVLYMNAASIPKPKAHRWPCCEDSVTWTITQAQYGKFNTYSKQNKSTGSRIKK